MAVKERNANYIGALFGICIIVLVIYFGVIETNKFLTIGVVLIVLTILTVIVLFLVAFHLYPPQHSIKKTLDKPMIQSEQAVSTTEQAQSQEASLLPFKLQKTSKKPMKNQKEIHGELKKVEHFYISIY